MSLLPSFLASSPSILLSQAFVLSPFITKPSEILRIASPVIVLNHSVLAGASGWNHKAATAHRGLLLWAQEAPPLSSPPGKLCQASFSLLPSPSFLLFLPSFPPLLPLPPSLSLSLPPPLSLILLPLPPPLYFSSSTFSSSSLNLDSEGCGSNPSCWGWVCRSLWGLWGLWGCRGPERAESLGKVGAGIPGYRKGKGF